MPHARLEQLGLDVRWARGAGAVLSRAGGATPVAQAEAAERVLREAGLETELREDDEGLWEAQREGQRSPVGLSVRVSALQTDLPDLLRIAERHGATLVGRSGLGLHWLRLDDGSPGELVSELRGRWTCAVLDRPPGLDLARDAGLEPGAEALMRRVKERFDPKGTLGLMAVSWDETRAPQLDLIDDCVHCGFCLPTCPTYVLWGEEMDSPRGRIVLMKQGHEEISAPLVGHLDNCLGCMACVTACPSGVQYDKLLEDSRAQVERNFERPPLERAHRRLVFELFTRPGRMRALAPGAALAHRLGLPRLARRPRLRRLAPRLSAVLSMTPDASAKRALGRLPERFEAIGEKRGTVALLQGCVQRVFFSHVNEATARVLAAEGFEVHVPRLPRCCGALPLHAGADPEARELAKATIEAFEGYDTVVVNAAGCGSAMKDYGHVLRDEPDWAERAAALRRPRARRDRAAGRARAARRAPPAADEGRLPRRLPPRPRPARARPAARAAALDPRAGAGGAARVGAVLRLGRDLQPGQARARRRAGRAKGAQPARHGRRGRGRGQPRLRPADNGAHRAPGPPAAGAAPAGAAGPLDRLSVRSPARQSAERWAWETSDWPDIIGGPGA